jgi:FkbM family methyltransferase
VVLKSLLPLADILNQYDFFGYRERSGDVTNNFMGARQNSQIANAYYTKICEILRSGQQIEWLTLGSNALTSTLQSTRASWFDLETDLSQPICWSKPEEFFVVRDDPHHEKIFNERSYCYMLSANMVNKVINEDRSQSIYVKNNFFNFLLRKSSEEGILSRISFRENTDDDKWIIPEVIVRDMYKIKDVLAALGSQDSEYVIDCGAHIGAFSVMCSRYLKNVEVIAFEPNPDSFELLSNNAVQFGNIKAINKAVSTTAGELNLYEPADSEWTGRWSVLPNTNNYISIEALDLFSYIKNLDKPVFILKMDIEGYEEYIVNNSSEEDFAGIKIIIVETHTDFFDHSKLLNFGFRLLFQPQISTHRQFVYSRIPVAR